MGVANAEQKAATKAGDDAAKAKWFDIENLSKNMAFDHDEMIKFAVKELEERWGEPHPDMERPLSTVIFRFFFHSFFNT